MEKEEDEEAEAEEEEDEGKVQVGAAPPSWLVICSNCSFMSINHSSHNVAISLDSVLQGFTRLKKDTLVAASWTWLR